MVYKDKDKQREADKERQRRHRAKSVTKGVADIRCDKRSVTGSCAVDYRHNTTGQVSKLCDADYVPQCEITKAFVEGKTITKAESHVDASDIGMVKAIHKCITIDDQAKSMETMAMLGATTAKRGKDIKTFEDLPPDVQQTIDTMSVVEGKIDQTIKANRTAIAIHYQHIFPGRY
jgi:hypothetical protein